MNKILLKFLPIATIILSVFIFFSPFFVKGNLPIPSDNIVGLYYPFRDLYSDTNPNGLPYKNFLLTDPVRQQYPWKNLVVNLGKQFQLPLWNPYEMAGTPLLANFQSSPFYPLNLILLIEPFSISWSLFIFLEPLLAGLFLYLYLRNLKLDKWASLLGSITWMFSGFFIAWLEWGVILHTVLWLPLILFAINKGFLGKDLKWKAVFIFSLSASFFAGHLQIFFYVFIFTLIYFIARLLTIKNKLRVLFLFIFNTLIVAGITFIQWWPTLQFIMLSNRASDQSFTQPGWFIPWQNLVQFIAPDFFGNPSTLNYFGVWNYGEFVGYVGIASIILVFYAMLSRHDKKTYFFAGALLASLLFSLPTVISSIPYLLNIPLLSTAQPTRLLGVSCFSLAVLSALGLDYLIKKKNKIWIPIVIIGVILGTLWVVTYTALNFYPNTEDLLVSRNNLKLPTILFIGISIILLAITFLKKKKYEEFLTFGLLIVVLFDLIRFGWKFTPFVRSEYIFPSTRIIEFLQNQKGVFRIAATDNRIFPPNFSVMYKLQSIEGYDPLYLKNYAEFIAANEREDHSINPPFGFNRIITPRNLNSQAIDVLNVKYVLSLSDINNTKYRKVFEEGNTKVYENLEILPRVFFVTNVESVSERSKIAEKIFENDLSDTAFVEENIGENNFSKGEVVIDYYSPNKVVIETNNSGKGFLIFSDAYYPTVSATIDGSPAKIYETDLAFRGIIVPAGNHTIVFQPKLF